MNGTAASSDEREAPSRRSHAWDWVARAGAVAALLTWGCAGADGEEPAPVRTVAETERAPIPASAACEDGATRECRITLNVRSGTVTCTTGIEECLHGAWGECFRTTDPEEELAQ
jgi:hypothetical protein